MVDGRSPTSRRPGFSTAGDRVQEPWWCPVLEVCPTHMVPRPALVLLPGNAASSSLTWGSAGSFANGTQLGEKLLPSFSSSSPLVAMALQRHRHHPHSGPGSICAAKGEIKGEKRSCGLSAGTKDRQKSAQLKRLMVCLFIFAIFHTSPNQECVGCSERCQQFSSTGLGNSLLFLIL